MFFGIVFLFILFSAGHQVETLLEQLFSQYLGWWLGGFVRIGVREGASWTC